MAERDCKALSVLTAQFSVSRAAFASTPTDQECQNYVGRRVATVPPIFIILRARPSLEKLGANRRASSRLQHSAVSSRYQSVCPNADRASCGPSNWVNASCVFRENRQHHVQRFVNRGAASTSICLNSAHKGRTRSSGLRCRHRAP